MAPQDNTKNGSKSNQATKQDTSTPENEPELQEFLSKALSSDAVKAMIKDVCNQLNKQKGKTALRRDLQTREHGKHELLNALAAILVPDLERAVIDSPKGQAGNIMLRNFWKERTKSCVDNRNIDKETLDVLRSFLEDQVLYYLRASLESRREDIPQPPYNVERNFTVQNIDEGLFLTLNSTNFRPFNEYALQMWKAASTQYNPALGKARQMIFTAAKIEGYKGVVVACAPNILNGSIITTNEKGGTHGEVFGYDMIDSLITSPPWKERSKIIGVCAFGTEHNKPCDACVGFFTNKGVKPNNLKVNLSIQGLKKLEFFSPPLQHPLTQRMLRFPNC